MSSPVTCHSGKNSSRLAESLGTTSEADKRIRGSSCSNSQDPSAESPEILSGMPPLQSLFAARDWGAAATPNRSSSTWLGERCSIIRGRSMNPTRLPSTQFPKVIHQTQSALSVRMGHSSRFCRITKASYQLLATEDRIMVIDSSRLAIGAIKSDASDLFCQLLINLLAI